MANEDKAIEHAARIDTIRAMLARSATSGASVPMDDAFEQLRTRHLWGQHRNRNHVVVE